MATLAVRREFEVGRDYWHQYVQLNGYAFAPNRQGVRKLAQHLGLSVKHVRHCINVFLEA